MKSIDTFQTRSELNIGNTSYHYYNLVKLAEKLDFELKKLPVSIKNPTTSIPNPQYIGWRNILYAPLFTYFGGGYAFIGSPFPKEIRQNIPHNKRKNPRKRRTHPVPFDPGTGNWKRESVYLAQSHNPMGIIIMKTSEYKTFSGSCDLLFMI